MFYHYLSITFFLFTNSLVWLLFPIIYLNILFILTVSLELGSPPSVILLLLLLLLLLFYRTVILKLKPHLL